MQVYALTGGLPHAIMPAVDLSKVKKKGGKAVRWGWLPFTPGSRPDHLQLHHWVRATRLKRGWHHSWLSNWWCRFASRRPQ